MDINMTQAALTITQGNFPLIWASSTIQASCPHCEKRQMRSHTAIKCSWGLHNNALFAAPLREQEAVVSSRMKGTISTLNEILMVNAKFVGQDDERTSQKVRSDALEALPYRRTITTADSGQRTAQAQMKEGRATTLGILAQKHPSPTTTLFWARRQQAPWGIQARAKPHR